MTDLRALSLIFAAVIALGLFVGSPLYDRWQEWRRR